MKTERRMTPTADIKVETRDDGRQMVTGYAAVFHRNDDPGTQYSLAKDFVERIAPSAFNRALADKHDARALFNHDPNHVLGRVGAGTLRLSVDNVGLRYEIDLPDTTTGTVRSLSA
jgi:HK97 family phage prohead protease